MKNKTHKLIIAITLAGLLFTSSANASPVGDFFGKITSFFYTPSGGEYTATDANGNDITFDRDKTEYLASIPADQASSYVREKFKAEFPADYIGLDASGIEVVSGEVSDVELTGSEGGNVVTKLLNRIIPGGGTSLASLIGMAGTLFYRRKNKANSAALNTSIMGVEAATTSGEVKAEILKRSLDDGTTATIQKVVKDLGAVQKVSK